MIEWDTISMDDSPTRSVSSEDGGAGIGDFVEQFKKAAVAIAFAGVVAVTALLVDLIGASRIAAIIVAWGVFMALIFVLFGVLPYWAIGFLGYRER